MTDPLICAIMLTQDRPAMAARAVAAFRAQTYANKGLLIWDSSDPKKFSDVIRPETKREHFVAVTQLGSPIGTLRNQANQYAITGLREIPDVIVHLDDDDLSHPNRIAEQVALLQSSGADCVGYNEVLFWSKWDVPGGGLIGAWERGKDGEAWLYSNRSPQYAIGSSLCYWRRVWEQRPFKDLMRGEDREFIRDIKTVGVNACEGREFRLVCSIHGGNTASYDLEEMVRRGSQEWSRVPHWDAYARERMAL